MSVELVERGYRLDPGPEGMNGTFQVNYFYKPNTNEWSFVKGTASYHFKNEKGCWAVDGGLRQVGQTKTALELVSKFAVDRRVVYFWPNAYIDYVNIMFTDLIDSKLIVSRSKVNISLKNGSVCFKNCKNFKNSDFESYDVMVFDHACSEAEGWFIKKYIEGWM